MKKGTEASSSLVDLGSVLWFCISIGHRYSSETNTDVTLVDEDTNITDEVNGAIRAQQLQQCVR